MSFHEQYGFIQRAVVDLGHGVFQLSGSRVDATQRTAVPIKPDGRLRLRCRVKIVLIPLQHHRHLRHRPGAFVFHKPLQHRRVGHGGADRRIEFVQQPDIVGNLKILFITTGVQHADIDTIHQIAELSRA